MEFADSKSTDKGGETADDIAILEWRSWEGGGRHPSSARAATPAIGVARRAAVNPDPLSSLRPPFSVASTELAGLSSRRVRGQGGARFFRSAHIFSRATYTLYLTTICTLGQGTAAFEHHHPNTHTAHQIDISGWAPHRYVLASAFARYFRFQNAISLAPSSARIHLCYLLPLHRYPPLRRHHLLQHPPYHPPSRPRLRLNSPSKPPPMVWQVLDL